MKKIWKLSVMIMCGALALGYVQELFILFKQMDWAAETTLWFGAGMLCFLPLWVLYFRRAGFFSTFEHEFTHLVVGLLFLKKPHSFNVSHQGGGHVRMYGGNFIITLAPYFVPTLVLLELPFYLLVKPEFYPYFFGLMGMLTAFTVLTGFQEFHLNQPDIRQSGLLFSLFVIALGNLIFLGFILAFVSGAFEGGRHYLLSGPEILWSWLSIQF